MEIVENALPIWERFPREHVTYLMNKVRDVSDYTDFAFDKVILADEVLVCNQLMEVLQCFGKIQLEQEELVSMIVKNLLPIVPLENASDVLQIADALVKLYPDDFYCKILAIYLYSKFETDDKLRENTIMGIQKDLLRAFVETYIEDDQFIGWYSDFVNGTYIGDEAGNVFAFSKFGEYELVLDYILRNPSIVELLEHELDKFLVYACLEINIAKSTEVRKEAVSHWRKAKSFLDTVYIENKTHQGVLSLMMLVAAELYDYEMVAECYETATKMIPNNPYIYCHRFKMYCSDGKPDDGKELFETANCLKIKNYRLRLWELIFHKSYDFSNFESVETYNLQKALESGHALLDEMIYCGVCGELLADAFFVFGELLSADGRYGNAPDYFHEAIRIIRKPEYLFSEALDAISDGKYMYEEALALFKQVYELREFWDDGESKNPRFSYVYERFRGSMLTMNDTTDLTNLYVLLGFCSEKLEEYVDAANYYRQAILINPSFVDVASAFVRVVAILFEEEGVSNCELEKLWDGFDESFEEFYSMKWLRARIAYENGDLETAKNILTPISKMKIKGTRFSEGDWVIYTDYLLAKIYHDDNKDMFAVKFLRKAVDGKRMDRMYRFMDNDCMTRRIFDEAKKLFVEMGYEEDV